MNAPSPQLADLVLFLDDPTTEEEAGLVSGMARVSTVGGAVMVPGTRHLDVPNLAVTTLSMGVFDVTHLPTGTTLVKDLDTLGQALLTLAQLHAIRTRYRLDLAPRDPLVMREAFTHVDAFPIPFDYRRAGALKPTVGQWLADARREAEDWKLPWETPAQLIREALEMIALCRPIVVTPPTGVSRVG
jgi:hypothetical protein